MTAGTAGRRLRRLDRFALVWSAGELLFCGVCVLNGWRSAASLSLALWLVVVLVAIATRGLRSGTLALRTRAPGTPAALALLAWAAPRFVGYGLVFAVYWFMPQIVHLAAG